MKRASVAMLLSGFVALLIVGLSGCGSSTQPISVALTPSSTKSIDQSQTVSLTVSVTHDANNAGVQWAVSGGGTLSAQTTTSATYNTPASVTSAFTATVTATSITDTTKSATLQIKVSPLPAITTTSLTATAGTAYSGTVGEAGGTSPYTWSITAGSLPTGLSLSSSTGAITGTATGASSGSVTFKVADAAGMSTSQAITLTVSPPPALAIATAPLAAGTIGTTYSEPLQATGGVLPYKWAVTAGSLPAGLTLNATTGAISGTPSGTFTGSSNFTVTVTDSETPTPATKSGNLSIAVNAPALSVTTASLAGGTIGTLYVNQTLGATGGISPYSWAVTTGSLPAGLSLNSATGVISGTPTGTFVGPVNFTVTVTDSETPTARKASANLGITISVAPLSVTTSGSLPSGVVNSIYAGATLQATGGILPYTWAVTTGSLPAGLSLNSTTGAILGTPTASGTVNFAVTVTDSETPTAKTAAANLSITINPAVTVTTTSLPAGVIGAAYSQALQATGGITPYSWAVTTGSLPAGLSLNAATGVISGTPSGTFTGTTNFIVTVTDSESPKKTASANLSIAITASTLSVMTASLPAGSINTAYSQTLQAKGGITPYTWAVTTGSLPAGLTLNATTGVISGSPSGTFVGAVNFTVTVTDSETPTPQKASAALSITISVAPLSVTTSGSLPAGIVNSVYVGATLQAAGGISPYTWSVTTGSLPAGLILNSATGAISGTPTTAGTTNFTVTVTDSETPTAKTASASLSITVNPAVTVTTTSLPAGVIGTSYPGATLQATGGVTPYTWAITVGSLPAGLTLNAATGAISGTPSGTLTGTVNFTVTVTDSETPKKTATANLSIAISVSTLSVMTTSLPGGSIGTAYNQTLQAKGGITPYTWTVTVGSLPAGLTLNATTGVISGSPSGTFVGAVNFTVTVTDSETPTPQTASASLSITISVAALSVTTTSLPTGVASTIYPVATLQATGGISPYTWSVTTGSLPAGLILNSATGAISGTPTASGTVNFTVTVTDSETPTAKTATANLNITVSPALTVTTASLPAGVIGTSYSQTLSATGGVTPYTWTISSGSLPAGLSLNATTGAITGNPTGPFVGTTNFTVAVTDSESPTKKNAYESLSIIISAPTLKVTTTTLPNGVLTNSYSATLQASGGVPSYTWAVTSGSLPAGLSLNAAGSIGGTPTSTGTFTFTVTVTDSETPTAQKASANLSISVNNSAPLTITTTGLPGGLVSTSYQNGLLQASGGVQPYIWSISAGTLPPGLSLNASTGAITGTPTTTGTSNFTVKVTDSTQPTALTATANLSITINGALTITTASVPNGSVGTQYNATVNASGGLQPYSWTITSGSLPPGLTSSTSNNSLNISGPPTTTGTYTFTAQVTDSENPTVSVSASFTIIVVNPAAAYTVSGTVTYSGSKTGWTYLELNTSNCNGCGSNLGTSISAATLTSGGAFTIHGVPPGTYTLQAYMDNIGYGAENASNPTGSTQNVTVTNSGVSGVGVALTDPAAVTLSSAPAWSSSNGLGAFNGGAFVSFNTIQNNNGIEMPASYTVQWSTSSSFTTVTGSKSFPATGGNNPWIVNGLANGTTYYFRAQGVAGSSTSNWSAASSGITIGAPTGGNAVSGTVTFSGTATGPLYTGFYDQSTGSIYVDQVGSEAHPPTSPASYSVNVPNGSNYVFFGIVDQNNTGLVGGPGEISNVNQNNAAPVVISGALTNEDLTLPSGNSVAVVMTQNSEQINQNGTSSNYTIGFKVNGLLKLPVAVELATGPAPGAVIPADIANNAFSGNSDKFNFWTSLNGVTPKVGDTYTLNVTYSDGTTQTLTVAVSAVLDALATNLSPQGSSVSLTPNFSWTDPANASNYTYQFWLCCNSNGTIWQIPGNNSSSNGFSSAITSITWGTDPTSSNNPPSVSALSGSTSYSWQIQASDTNGDSAQVVVNFETIATPLTLPAAGSVGTAVIGQSFSGAINASGGTGPNYTFTVNGTTVPTNGTAVSLGDGLTASNTGGNTLSLGGTPTAAQTVSFTVSVTDSASDTVGPYTYTIAVSAVAALSIQSTTLTGGDKGWAYNTYLQANGGTQPYTWTVTSGTLPGGLSINQNNNNDGNGGIAGIPSAAGTSPFTLMVTDSETPPVSVSASFSITIGDCGNNANLHGNYAFLVNGWKGTTDANSSAGSFVADGAGNLSSGSLDTSDQSNGPSTGTFTGTYCVSSTNLALLNILIAGNSSPTTLAVALDASDGNGHIIHYDPTSSSIVSGLLRKQTTSAFSTSSIDGNYAFGIIGADQNSNRFGIAGEFNSNGTGTLSGEVDYDDGCSGSGCGAGNTTMTASNFTVASNGRGTASVTFTGPASTINFVYYVVSSSEMLTMAVDNSESPSMILAGDVLKQVPTSGTTFNQASLNGVSVIELQGVSNSGTSPNTTVGFITTNGAGTVSIAADQNQGGTMGTLCAAGDYLVSSNGRTTLSNFVDCGGGSGGHNPVFYLVGLNQAFVAGTDNSVTFGTMVPQVGSGFTLASLTGNYMGGSEEPVDWNANTEVDQVHADGAGNITGTGDDNKQCGSGCSEPNGNTIVATYALASGGPDGKFVISQDGVPQVYLYMISTSQAVIMPVSSSDNSSSHPGLIDFHQ
jgi:hypothetical protein